jgi:hypothetical protein
MSAHAKAPSDAASAGKGTAANTARLESEVCSQPIHNFDSTPIATNFTVWWLYQVELLVELLRKNTVEPTLNTHLARDTFSLTKRLVQEVVCREQRWQQAQV